MKKIDDEEQKIERFREILSDSSYVVYHDSIGKILKMIEG